MLRFHGGREVGKSVRDKGGDDQKGTVQSLLWAVAMTACKESSEAQAMTNLNMVTGIGDQIPSLWTTVSC